MEINEFGRMIALLLRWCQVLVPTLVCCLVECIHVAPVPGKNPSGLILQRGRWIGVAQLLADVHERDSR